MHNKTEEVNYPNPNPNPNPNANRLDQFWLQLFKDEYQLQFMLFELTVLY